MRYMYNKLFTKILDSSIWLEPPGTRIVWLTLIAAMDEDGLAQFASVANLAHRARIPEAETEAAVKCLESPDPNSSDPDFEGRRIERIPGGWIVLNSTKYRDLVTRTVARERTRIRVARHRAKAVTPCNAGVTPVKRSVTPSEAGAEAGSKSKNTTCASFSEFWSAYPRKIGKGKAEASWKKLTADERSLAIESIAPHIESEQWKRDGGQFIPHPSTFLNQRRWEDVLESTEPKRNYWQSPNPGADQLMEDHIRERILENFPQVAELL